MPRPTKSSSLPPVLGPSERRTWQRHECCDMTRCQVPSSGQQFWVRVRNLSVRSVGLVLDRPLEPGTCLVLDLGAPGRLTHAKTAEGPQ